MGPGQSDESRLISWVGKEEERRKSERESGTVRERKLRKTRVLEALMRLPPPVRTNSHKTSLDPCCSSIYLVCDPSAAMNRTQTTQDNCMHFSKCHSPFIPRYILVYVVIV